MNTPKLNMIAVSLIGGLILAGGVHAQMGQTKGTSHKGGMGQCCMGMSPPAAPSVPDPLSSGAGAKVLKITAVMASPAKTGDNTLNISLTNAAGKPITAAKITAQVGMTSMDMGTTSPDVKEMGKGHYATTVAFNMAGPWRVTLKVIAPGRKPQVKAFNFTAN